MNDTANVSKETNGRVGEKLGAGGGGEKLKLRSQESERDSNCKILSMTERVTQDISLFIPEKERPCYLCQNHNDVKQLFLNPHAPKVPFSYQTPR